MRIYCTKDYKEMSRKAANLISAQVIIKPDCVLGLATGSTPIGIYDQLVEWYHKNDIDFSEVTTVNLDEYRGLTKENGQSYYYFMHTHLFDRVNIRPDHSFIPDELVRTASLSAVAMKIRFVLLVESICSFLDLDVMDISDLMSHLTALHR